MEKLVSIVLTTCDRPELFVRAVSSIKAQTYKNWELLIVDDGGNKVSANDFSDSRIKYFKTSGKTGGSAARNRGIREANADFIAFLDDDDQWFEKKLAKQMASFGQTPAEVGFCYTAVVNMFDNRKEITKVEEGISDCFEPALKGRRFLTSTLIIKKKVFDKVGMFDEAFPASQEADLNIRIAKYYRGCGLNEPLVEMNLSSHDHLNSSYKRRIAGKLLLIDKHYSEFIKRPEVLARRYFGLGLLYRDSNQPKPATLYFKKAWQTFFKPRYFAHYIYALTRI